MAYVSAFSELFPPRTVEYPNQMTKVGVVPDDRRYPSETKLEWKSREITCDDNGSHHPDVRGEVSALNKGYVKAVTLKNQTL